MRQPWAWAIVHGGKDVENRTRNVAGSYRGPVAIHAGLAWDEDGLRNRIVGDAAMRVDPEKPVVCWFNGKAWRYEETLVRGAFVGIADLVDVHTCRAEELDQGTVQCCGSAWAQFEFVETRALCESEPQRLGAVVHLVLANPRPLEVPIPARGMLGLWTPPPAVLEQLQAVTR